MSKDGDDLITRGLAERERKRAGRSSPLESLQGLPRDLAAILALGASAELKATRCREFYDGITAALVEFERVEKARLAAIAFTYAPDRDKLLKQSVAQKRKELLDISGLADDRKTIRQALSDMKAQAIAVRAMYADPVVVLTRSTIASEKAGRYRDALRNSGPVEIRAMLETSVSTNDRDLASACFGRMDAMSDDDRRHVGITKKDVALVLAGPESRAALAACDNISLQADMSEHKAKLAEGVTVSAGDRIELGMRGRDLAADIAAISDDKPKIPEAAE